MQDFSINNTCVIGRVLRLHMWRFYVRYLIERLFSGNIEGKIRFPKSKCLSIYITWKVVDGATAMYWFIMAPYYKRPCRSCAIYFTTVYVWSLKIPWSPYPMNIPRSLKKDVIACWIRDDLRGWTTLNNGPLNHPSLKEGSQHFSVTLMVFWLYQLLFFRHSHITVEKPSSVPFMLYQRWISSYMFTYLYRFPWNKQNSSPLWRGEVVVVMTLRFMASKCHLGFKQKAMAWLDDLVWFSAFRKIPRSQKTLTILHTYHISLIQEDMFFLISTAPT